MTIFILMVAVIILVVVVRIISIHKKLNKIVYFVESNDFNRWNSFSMVAEKKGEEIATILNCIIINGEVLIGDHIFVYPEFRRKGIGTEIFRCLEDYAKQRGCKGIKASGVRPYGDYGEISEKDVKKFAEKLGFKKIDDQYIYIIKDEEEVIKNAKE